MRTWVRTNVLFPRPEYREQVFVVGSVKCVIACLVLVRDGRREPADGSHERLLAWVSERAFWSGPGSRNDAGAPA